MIASGLDASLTLTFTFAGPPLVVDTLYCLGRAFGGTGFSAAVAVPPASSVSSASVRSDVRSPAARTAARPPVLGGVDVRSPAARTAARPPAFGGVDVRSPAARRSRESCCSPDSGCSRESCCSCRCGVPARPPARGFRRRPPPVGGRAGGSRRGIMATGSSHRVRDSRPLPVGFPYPHAAAGSQHGQTRSTSSSRHATRHRTEFTGEQSSCWPKQLRASVLRAGPARRRDGACAPGSVRPNKPASGD